MVNAQELELLDKIQQRILAIVTETSPYPPRALFANLRREGFDENTSRAAMWFLVDAGKLDFSQNRELIVVTTAGNGRAH
jgi:hypothetical protein